MRIVSIVLSVLLLSGCGLIEEVNQTVDYGKKTTQYIETMIGFQNDVSGYLNQDQLTTEDLEQLKGIMDDIEAEAESFNEIEPPSIAEGVHGQIENQNDQILQAIDEANSQIDQGEFDPNAFQDLEIVQSLQKLNEYKDQVDQFMN
ncbi:DUF6376 family protein [Tenuibacillus multivorans]|uniref:Lipoprotein n=1 Tax=Tenuibacillus multivorans TaxID=237069 RepID=A0A1G9WTN4_9BACI|nr:DUF6376 family protein [Tenuibacillus multivorans]GEL77943.1 hypothetical protein TMU01_21780 [Tenuibacillus multivorans]SDM87493.1 hypothetical protein SAMN05216498_0875 [Tenuibacillus multivorans]